MATSYLSDDLNCLFLVLSGKGGVGKTTLTLALANLLELNECTFKVIQVDDQTRLAQSLNKDVISIDLTNMRRARRDPTILTKSFQPIYEGVEWVASTRGALLIDVGATQQNGLLEYAGLIELDDDLAELAVPSIILIPTLAEPESINQTLRVLDELDQTLPSARPIVVLNERDQDFEGLHPQSDAGELWMGQLQPRLTNIPTVKMPAIEAGSWLAFERQHCGFLDVIGFDVPTAMAVSGLPRPEAKLARGDVAAWFSHMEQELGLYLPFAGGDQ